VTVARSVTERHALTVDDAGLTLTATVEGGGGGGGGGGGAVTVTTAVADRVASAVLVATTLHVAAAPGAVYSPELVTAPQPLPVTDQTTSVTAEPVTVASKATDPPTATSAEGGSTRTSTPCAPGPGVPGAAGAGSPLPPPQAAESVRRRKATVAGT
jgi:hypothetical protein